MRFIAVLSLLPSLSHKVNQSTSIAWTNSNIKEWRTLKIPTGGMLVVKYMANQLEAIIPSGERSEILNIGSGMRGIVPILTRFGKVIDLDISEEALLLSSARGVTNITMLRLLYSLSKVNRSP